MWITFPVRNENSSIKGLSVYLNREREAGVVFCQIGNGTLPEMVRTHVGVLASRWPPSIQDWWTTGLWGIRKAGDFPMNWSAGVVVSTSLAGAGSISGRIRGAGCSNLQISINKFRKPAKNIQQAAVFISSRWRDLLRILKKSKKRGTKTASDHII